MKLSMVVLVMVEDENWLAQGSSTRVVAQIDSRLVGSVGRCCNVRRVVPSQQVPAEFEDEDGKVEQVRDIASNS